jgi:hypothetical protein
VSSSQFNLLEDLDTIRANSAMNITDLRLHIVTALQQVNKLPIPFPPSQLRLRDRYGTNPGRILRDGSSFEDIQVYLVDNKCLAYQVLTAPEHLPNDADSDGDVIVYIQRWVRSTWSLRDRVEVLLPGYWTIQDIARGLAALLDIADYRHLRVLIVPKETEFYLSELNQSKPVRNYGRAWFDPSQERKVLSAMSQDMRIQDGDLLVIQDVSEDLMELSVADRKSIEIVEAALRDPYSDMWGAGSSSSYAGEGAYESTWPYNHYSSTRSHSVGTGTVTSPETGSTFGPPFYNSTTGGTGTCYPSSGSINVKWGSPPASRASTGIRIKTQKDRQKEESEVAEKRASKAAFADELGHVLQQHPLALHLGAVTDSQAGRTSPVSGEHSSHSMAVQMEDQDVFGDQDENDQRGDGATHVFAASEATTTFHDFL